MINALIMPLAVLAGVVGVCALVSWVLSDVRRKTK